MKRILIVIAAWAAVRLLLLPLVHPVLMQGDDLEYVQGAKDMLAGHGIAGRSPFYSAFLAVTLWLGPAGIFAIQSAITLAAALLTLVYIGFWPALLIAACPFFPMFEWMLLTETWSWALLWCGWLLLFWPAHPRDRFMGIGLLALAVLTRSTFLFIPLLAAIVVWARRDRRSALGLLTAYLPIALVMAQAHGQNYFGFTLWIGTWERNGEWKARTITEWPAEATSSPRELKLLREAWAARDDRAFRDKALERYRTQPVQVLSAWIHRYPWLWIGTRTDLMDIKLTRFSVTWYAFKGVTGLLDVAVLALGLIGAALAVYRRDRMALMALPVGYIALVYVPFHNTETRYSLAAIPFLIALGCYAVLQLPKGYRLGPGYATLEGEGPGAPQP